jgi:hypothetical protein
MRGTRGALRAVASVTGGVLMLGALAAPAYADVVPPRCSTVVHQGAISYRACIMEPSAGVFWGYTEISAPNTHVLVETNLVQCGSTCGIVTGAGSGQHEVFNAHVKVYTTPWAGAHGHSYAAQGDVSIYSPVLSPYLSYP